MKHVIESLNGIYYKITIRDNSYSIKENELYLSDVPSDISIPFKIIDGEYVPCEPPTIDFIYDDNMINTLKQSKISTLSATCEQTIYAGLELELSAGTERFEYKDKDQTNIKAMFDAVVLGAQKYPYQSEDGNCRIFTKEDIMTLYPSLEGLRTGQLTYYNQLKKYVNTLQTAEEINSVIYGQPLEGEYLQHYNEMMQVAEEQMGLVLSKVVQNVT